MPKYTFITDEELEEQEQFEAVCAILEMSGEYLASEIEDEAHYIMCNKIAFPEFF